MGVKEYEENKRKTIASFVKDGVVDWGRWKHLEGRSGSYNEEIKEGLISHLLEIGILSLTPEGNHRVTDGGLNLGPNIHICGTYFTSRDQARSYANTLFSKTHYDVRIEKLSEVESVQQRR